MDNEIMDQIKKMEIESAQKTPPVPSDNISVQHNPMSEEFAGNDYTRN